MFARVKGVGPRVESLGVRDSGLRFGFFLAKYKDLTRHEPT